MRELTRHPASAINGLLMTQSGLFDAPSIRATFECYREFKRARLVMRRVVPHMVYTGTPDPRR